MTGVIRIGISGWNYPPWRGVFYPKTLRRKDELGYAAARFNTIEINGTFYATQRPQSFLNWFEAAPDDFVFAVKAPRYITHLLRLRNVETPLANFLASGVLRLGRKLGPVLWQLPPNMTFDEGRLAAFFSLLPHDGKAAMACARRHDGRLKGEPWLEIEPGLRLRHAVEIRHESFRDERFVALLRRYDVALVCADSVAWPRLMDVTSDFIYCRLHGAKALYASGYDENALSQWARWTRRWAAGGEPRDTERIDGKASVRQAGCDVFLYFDNDAKVKAPENALALARLVAA